MSSAAILFGALRVNIVFQVKIFFAFFLGLHSHKNCFFSVKTSIVALHQNKFHVMSPNTTPAPKHKRSSELAPLHYIQNLTYFKIIFYL